VVLAPSPQHAGQPSAGLRKVFVHLPP
jgi:hypothetical protein